MLASDMRSQNSDRAAMLLLLLQQEKGDAVNIAVNTADSTGRTPLMFACGHSCDSSCASSPCDTAVVQVLLAHGAGVLAADAEDRTSLSAAATVGADDLVAVLLGAGAAAAVDKAAVDGRTALHAATMALFTARPGADHAAVVRQLLDHEASVAVQDHAGFTPLHLAIQRCCSISIIEQLLAAAAPLAAAAVLEAQTTEAGELDSCS
jgi:ankyrin repeat protein